jgi:molybdate transport system substrate-binding protein
MTPLPAALAAAVTLRVFAAASLADAFREIAAVHERAHPGHRVELNLGGSPTLRTQIEQGAPADVFASADLEHAQALVRAGLLGPTRVVGRNRLVVAVPARGARVSGLAGLAAPGTKVVLAGPNVPAGRYAAEVLARLGASGLYGEGFAARVQSNVVSHETNVRAVLSKVALGEADAGFVYTTDMAAGGREVAAIEIPERHNVVAEYPVGVVSRSAAPAAAQAFVETVAGPEGQAVLRRHGFAP